MSFQIIEEPDRVSAVDENDIEIVGAYRPRGHNYWLLYATALTVRKTGIRIPHHAAFWDSGGGHAQKDATQWVRLIASLYTGSNEGVQEDVA